MGSSESERGDGAQGDLAGTVLHVAPDLALTQRAQILARAGTMVLLLIALGSGTIGFIGADSMMQMSIFATGLVMLAATSIYSGVALTVWHRAARRVLRETIAFDLLAAGLLVWSTAVIEDPVYPWLLGLAVTTAVVPTRQAAWLVPGSCAAVYVAGHVIGHPQYYEIGPLLFVAFKAGSLVFAGIAMSMLARAQQDRQERMSLALIEAHGPADELSRRLSELHAISEITEVIHSTLDFDETGPLVLEILSKVIDLPASCMFVIDKQKAETLFSASAGLAPAGWRSYGGQVSLGGEPTVVSEEGGTFACQSVVDHKDMMVVFCAPSRSLDAMTEEDRLVLSAVGSELLVAVENSQLYKLTKRLSITDELTGLRNYRYLQQRLEDEIERARRYGRSVSLLMLDADDFKRFNDAHGHIAGDLALAEFGGVLQSAVREIDIVARYGGEEFSVVLPETDSEGAFVVAEKIREMVAGHVFADENGVRQVHMTVSIGLATFPAMAADKEELLRQADDALYNAKNLGRDRVRAPGGKAVADEAAAEK